jgi:hypothetical protein
MASVPVILCPCDRLTIRIKSSLLIISRISLWADKIYIKVTKPEVAYRSPNMDSDQQNPQLSFDVLGLIFSHYTEEENIGYPLETLLLVCRSWSNAALGHRALWNNLRIIIGHEPTISMWKARLPLRLARCALHSPLDIMLRNQLDSPYECRKFAIRWIRPYKVN